MTNVLILIIQKRDLILEIVLGVPVGVQAVGAY